MLHHSSKHEGAYERNRKRVSHSLIVLLEGVLINIQSQLAVQVFEEDATHIVTLADDDGILLAQLLKVGKGRSEHRVSRYIAHTSLFVKILQIGLHTGDIADDTLLRQVRYHLFKHRYSIFQRHCINQQLGLEFLNLLERGETLTIVSKPHAFGVSLKHSHLVVKTQQVDEERTHLSCSHY